MREVGGKRRTSKGERAGRAVRVSVKKMIEDMKEVMRMAMERRRRM